MVINRDLEHLKQSAVAFIKEEHCAPLIKAMPDDLWLEYTDYILKRDRAKIQKKLTVKKRPAKIVTSAKKVGRDKKVNRDIVFSWPINHANFWISSFFGPRKKPDGTWGFHYGVDMAAVRRTPVKSAAAGNVIEACFAKGYGNTIVIAHNRKYKTRYAHLDSIGVSVGQRVDRSKIIGRVGDTGSVRKSGKDASHLHFEVYAFGKHENPLYFLV